MDHRGLFINAFRIQDEGFKKIWGKRVIRQVNISETKAIGCIRGMHLQRGKFAEAKLIKCIKGSVFDVAVDLRKDSITFGTWTGVELSEQKSNSILIPEGCAHGFQVLEENSKILYVHSDIWSPEHEEGVKFDDTQLNIKWPLSNYSLGDKDLLLPSLKEYELQM